MFVPFNDLTRIHTPLKKGVIKNLKKLLIKTILFSTKIPKYLKIIFQNLLNKNMLFHVQMAQMQLSCC